MEQLTSEWIEEAKKKYGRIGKVTVGGVTYVFRQLKRKEHIDIQKSVFPNGVPTDQTSIKMEENTQIEDKIIETCVIWPENLDLSNTAAGVPQSVTPSILVFSGFAEVQQPEEI